MLHMPRIKRLLLLSVLLTSGCATSVPVAVTCPPPAPVPQVLTEPVSTGPSLSEQWNDSMNAARESLNKATRPSKD